MTEVSISKDTVAGSAAGRSEADPDYAAESYEKELARLLKVEHVIAFAYARHALTAILESSGLQSGDEVILSPLTCKVVPLALLALELEPVYVDISPKSLNLDAGQLVSRIGPATKAVLFQHTYGHAGGIGEVVKIAHERGLMVVEDCAQAMPSLAGCPRAATLGDAAIFSNNLRKPLTAGSGGLAVTRNADLAERLRTIRDRLGGRGALGEATLGLEMLAHKHILKPERYWSLLALSQALRPFYREESVASEIRSQILDTELRISSRQAREGSAWLSRIDQIIDNRRRACSDYARALSDIPGIELPCPASSEALYFFPICVDKKQELLRVARRRRIELVAWPLKTPIYPVEDEALLHRYGYRLESCPESERIARRLVGLPTDPRTTRIHREKVIELVKQVCAGD